MGLPWTMMPSPRFALAGLLVRYVWDCLLEGLEVPPSLNGGVIDELESGVD